MDCDKSVPRVEECKPNDAYVTSTSVKNSQAVDLSEEKLWLEENEFLTCVKDKIKKDTDYD